MTFSGRAFTKLVEISSRFTSIAVVVRGAMIWVADDLILLLKRVDFWTRRRPAYGETALVLTVSISLLLSFEIVEFFISSDISLLKISAVPMIGEQSLSTMRKMQSLSRILPIRMSH